MNDAPWARLQVKPWKAFRKPPIALAIAQVQFSSQPNFQDSAVIEQFHAQIADSFPESRQVTGFSVELTLQADVESPSMSSMLAPVTTQFFDDGRIWVASLGTESMSLECRDYDGFAELGSRFHLCLGALTTIVETHTLRRFGLRYINEAREQDFPPRFVANDELAGIERHSVLANSIVTSHQILQFEHDDKHINLQHGYFPSGTTVMPVESSFPTDAFYLLDIDVFRDFDVSSEMRLEAAGLGEMIGDFHDISSSLFRWAISETYDTFLGEVQ